MPDASDSIEQAARSLQDAAASLTEGGSALDRVRLLAAAEAAVPVLLAAAVDEARTLGTTWREVADTVGLATAQGAFNRWAAGADHRSALSKVRSRDHRELSSSPPPARRYVDLPGLSANDAASRLGVTWRTLTGRRTEHGEVLRIAFTSADSSAPLRGPGGSPWRYFIEPVDAATASEVTGVPVAELPARVPHTQHGDELLYFPEAQPYWCGGDVYTVDGSRPDL